MQKGGADGARAALFDLDPIGDELAGLAAHPGAYDGMTAAFTAGGDDPTYVTAAQTVSAAAQRAGMSVSLDIIPGAGHTGNALTSGLQITVGKMYPALGLSPG